MDVSVVRDDEAVVLNELGPVLVFALAFVLVMGGAMVFAVALCGWGHVNFASIDFWKGLVKIQCK